MTTPPIHTRQDIARILALVLALVFGGLALSAAVYGWVFARDAQVIAADGVDTRATVTDLTETRRMIQGRPETEYHVRLTFTDRTGTVQTVRREITGTRHAALLEGDSVPITYSASRPTLITFSDSELPEAVARARMLGIILALLALPCFAAWIWLRRKPAVG
jgi:hypothetical protein